MKNDLSCEVVRDLLPSYLDGLVGEVTEQAVKNHLKACRECGEVCERMRAPEPENRDDEVRETEYLRASRRYARVLVCIGVVVTAIVLATVFAARSYLVGQQVAEADMLDCKVLVSGKKVTVYGKMVNPEEGVGAIDFSEEDGTVRIAFRQTLVSAYHKNEFCADYESEETINQVWLANRIVWDQGTEIDPRVSAIYQTKHLYIGDMPANERTLKALGFYERMGMHTHELQTGEEPYGWKLIRSEPEDYMREGLEFRKEEMQEYAAVLLCLIDNLDHVTYEYRVGGKEEALTITRADADELAGGSVRDMSGSPTALQRFLDRLGLVWTGLHTMKDYTKKADGTWECGGDCYQYRLTLRGREPGMIAARDSVFVVLTDNLDVKWEEIRSSLDSSRLEPMPVGGKPKWVLVEKG